MQKKKKIKFVKISHYSCIIQNKKYNPVIYPVPFFTRRLLVLKPYAIL